MAVLLFGNPGFARSGGTGTVPIMNFPELSPRVESASDSMNLDPLFLGFWKSMVVIRTRLQITRQVIDISEKAYDRLSWKEDPVRKAREWWALKTAKTKYNDLLADYEKMRKHPLGRLFDPDRIHMPHPGITPPIPSSASSPSFTGSNRSVPQGNP